MPIHIGQPAVTTTQPRAYGETAFGEVRVAARYPLADQLQTYEIDALEWGTQTVGGGTLTYNGTTGETTITVTNANADAARLSTHAHYRYQAGASQRVTLAVRHADAGQTGQVRRWGYFDGADGFGGTGDGVFFQLSGTTLSIVRRTSTGEPSGPEFTTARASWYDPMDGTGPSGQTLDLTKGNVYELDLQWSYGKVAAYINGNLVAYAHLANTTVYPHIRTAILPVRAEVVNTSASTGSSLYFCRASVSSEGGQLPTGIAFAAQNSASITVNATERPLFSLRPSYLFKTFKNRQMLTPRHAMVMTEGQKAGFSIWINPTLTGATWANTNADGGYDWDQAATALTGGQLIGSGFLPSADSVATRELTDDFGYRFRKLLRRAFASSASDCDIITVSGYGKGAGSSGMRVALSFDVIR